METEKSEVRRLEKFAWKEKRDIKKKEKLESKMAKYLQKGKNKGKKSAQLVYTDESCERK